MIAKLALLSKPGHLTTCSYSKPLTIIDKYCIAKNKKVFAFFVDLKKAFDTVIHEGIKLKLLEIGSGSLCYNIIKNMYAVSKSCVKIDDTLSVFFPYTIRG